MSKAMNTNRRGVVLLLVLVVVALLALASLTFCDLMLNERRAAETAGRQARARAFAHSGVQLAQWLLEQSQQDQIDAGGIYDNPRQFANMLVADDLTPQQRGYFSLVAPKYENNSITGVRYGLQDESSRININMLLQMKTPDGKDKAKDILMALPSMTDEIADAILDWLDTDSNPRDNGAEAEYYASRTPPYTPRNGPLQSIEELLLVRGVTPQLLFGLDAAPMGLIDGADGNLQGVDNSDGSMDHGWAAYLTLCSAESTSKPDGTKKINLNGDDLKKLYDDLKEALDDQKAKFIWAYRKYGPKPNSHAPPAPLDAIVVPAQQTTPPAAGGNPSQSSGGSLTSALELIDAVVEVPMGSGSATHQCSVKSPFTEGSLSSDLPKLMEKTTAHSEETIKGRININQAPRRVLLCIPGVTSDVADSIIAKRVEDPKDDADEHRCEMWPLSEGVVPLKTMRDLEPFITAGGCVYRAQVLGTFANGGPTARLDVVIDAGKMPTKLLFWKDISRLPTGFPVERAAARANATNNP